VPTGGRGAYRSITIQGGNFQKWFDQSDSLGTVSSITVLGGAGVSVTTVAWQVPASPTISPSSMTVTVYISTDPPAPLGWRSIQVRNPDGQSSQNIILSTLP